MKYTLKYSEYLIKNDINYILNDRKFIKDLSFSSIFTESEGKYIRNIIKDNKIQSLNEMELSIIFNYSEMLHEGFFSSIRDKSKSIMNSIGSNVSSIFNNINIFVKKYIDEIINSFDKTFNIFGKKNDESNQKMAYSLYDRYKENIGTMVKKFDAEEIKWYDDCHSFLLNTYNDVLSIIKKMFISETNTMLKESILNGDFIFEYDKDKQIDDHLNDKLKYIKEISIKIDQYINTKFLWLFKILNSVISGSLQGLSKAITLGGGPKEPKNGFKTTSTTFLYVIQNKYLELSAYVSRYTNTKTIVSGIFKKAFKKMVQVAIPGTGIMFKLIGLINNLDITRRLLQVIEQNK